MIINGPGFDGGKCPQDLTSLIDLPPTIMTAAGITPPDAMRGHALQRLLADHTTDWPEEIFFQISESQCGRAIRTRRWKYSVRAPDKSGHDPSSDVYVEDFLYDLEADPHERNNLVADPDFREIREELALTLKRRIVEAGEIDILQAEADNLGVTHIEVGEALMNKWGMPSLLTQCVVKHHDIDHVGPFAIDTSMVYLANHLSKHELVHDEDEMQKILSTIANWQQTECTLEQINIACQLADEQWFDVMESLGMVESSDNESFF